MKTILKHLTGIVLLITVLVAGSCTEPGDAPPDNRGNIKVYCKVLTIEDEMHFIIYDSNDTIDVVIDPTSRKAKAELTTDVKARKKVTWIWAGDSEIDEFVKIGPMHPNGKIMPENAKKVPLTKKLMVKIPRDATKGEQEYIITFKDKDDNTFVIDPYLKIP